MSFLHLYGDSDGYLGKPLATDAPLISDGGSVTPNLAGARLSGYKR